jgi:hypothetical protein
MPRPSTQQAIEGHSFCVGVSSNPSFFVGLNEKAVSQCYHFHQGLRLWRSNSCAGQVEKPNRATKKARCTFCAMAMKNISRWKKDQQRKSSTRAERLLISAAEQFDHNLLVRVVQGDKNSLTALELQYNLLMHKQGSIPTLVCCIAGIDYVLLPCSMIPVENIISTNGLRFSLHYSFTSPF